MVSDDNGPLIDKITYKSFLVDRKIWLLYLASMMSVFCLIFMDATLSLRLKELGVHEENIGYFFAIAPLGYAISAIVVGSIANKVNRPIFIFVFFVLTVPCLWLIGPSTLLGFP